jgi:hypothetical protein
VTALDRLLPAWDERSRHELFVPAEPARADASLRAVRLSDLPLTRILMTLRGLRRERRDRVLLASFLDGPFALLVDEPGHEVVLGLIAQPWRLRGGETREIADAAAFTAFREPGFVRVVVGFESEPAPGGALLATETRIAATDPGARRAFRRYWRVVAAGSGLIRRDILRAARRRA